MTNDGYYCWKENSLQPWVLSLSVMGTLPFLTSPSRNIPTVTLWFVLIPHQKNREKGAYLKSLFCYCLSNVYFPCWAFWPQSMLLEVNTSRAETRGTVNDDGLAYRLCLRPFKHLWLGPSPCCSEQRSGTNWQSHTARLEVPGTCRRKGVAPKQLISGLTTSEENNHQSP